MAEITVKHKIEDNGICEICECNIGEICVAFKRQLKIKSLKTEIGHKWESIQLQQCKDFLAAEVKTFCVDCKHFTYNYDCSECDLGNENVCGDSFCPGDWYLLNCKSKEQV
jgi:hypothetical protein